MSNNVVPIRDQDEPRPLRPLIYSEETEASLIGCALYDPRILDGKAEAVRPEHFAVGVHAKIWAAILALHQSGRRPSVELVRSHMDRDIGLVDVGGGQYIARLAAAIVTTVNAGDLAAHIIDLAQRRRVAEIAQGAIDRASQVDFGTTAEQIITDTEAQLYELAEGVTGDRQSVDAGEAFAHALQLAQDAQQRGTTMTGITTGFADLDRMTGGLEAGNLYVVAGRPGMGKTALALWLAWATARAGSRVAFFSLEMSAIQLMRRIGAPLVGLSPFDLKRGAVPDNDWVRLIDVEKDLRKLPIKIDDRGGLTVAQMHAEARRLKRRGGLGLVVVDHLGLVKPPPEAAREGGTWQIGKISNALKRLAKDLDVPVLALSQLSRMVEGRDDKRPTLADLRQSGEIEQDADAVAFVYREHYYASRQRPGRKTAENDASYNGRIADWMAECQACANTAEVIIAKQRDGAIGTVELFFDETLARFQNLHRG